ncbi:MAG: helicase C-terminal domain-containing protein [Vulcanisaeta sp. AZ3]
MKINDYIYSLLKDQRTVLLNAYPGFGKSRMAIDIVRRWIKDGGEVLVVTRSRAEALQLCEFAVNEGIRDRVSLFLGRELLCPFNAKDSKQCFVNRLSGLCRVQKVNSSKQFLVCNPLELFNEGLCPYEVNEALAYQLPVVIATHANLSSPELYSRLIDIINNWSKPLVIIDEFHNVAAGLEVSVPISIDELIQWALRGNEIARRVLSRIKDIMPEREIIVLRKFNIDELLAGSSAFSDKVVEMLMHYGNDICVFTYDGKLVRLRCLSLSPIRDLLMRVHSALLLTASMSRRFSSIANATVKSVHYMEIESIPREYQDNLTVILIRNLEFTFRNRLMRNYLNVVNRGIKTFIESAPPVGGLAIFFPSIDYMNTYLSNYSPPIWGVPTFILDNTKITELIAAFKESARSAKSVLITYAYNPISEGINFLDQELIGIMIVGLPLPQYSQWGFVKAHYYSRMGISGFATAFLFPAISTTIQVVGRLLRSLERHKKVAVLFDDRYYRYRRYMPKWLLLSMEIMSFSQFLKWSWP